MFCKFAHGNQKLLHMLTTCTCYLGYFYNESTTGADASVEALKLYHIYEANLSLQ